MLIKLKKLPWSKVFQSLVRSHSIICFTIIVKLGSVVEADEVNPSRRNSITSLSLSHLAYSSLSLSTASTSSTEKSRLFYMPGAMRTIFQALCMVGIIAPFPAVGSLGKDAKVATDEAGILIMGPIAMGQNLLTKSSTGIAEGKDWNSPGRGQTKRMTMPILRKRTGPT